MKYFAKTAIFLAGCLCLNVIARMDEKATETYKKVHAISLYGEPKYKQDFTNFDYANPDAIKGGTIRHGVVGSFDSIMPYINKGVSASGIVLTYDTLLSRAWDEPLTKYGLVAETIKLDPNNFWVEFSINSLAKFHDGSKITAEDIKFSFDTLVTKGSTFYRNFYRDVDKVEVVDKKTVLFTFKNNINKELALILGQMPIFSQKYWQQHDFTSPKLADIPVSSGPYKIVKVDQGRSIVYQRVADYWAKDLPVNKGRHNFDTIIYEYYLNSAIMAEDIKRGYIHFQIVTDPKDWHSYYHYDKLAINDMQCDTISNKNPQTLTLTFNQRKSSLQDSRVRQALCYLVDISWLNNNLFHNIYQPARSIYAGTDFSAISIPKLEEQKILQNWSTKLNKELFTNQWSSALSIDTSRQRQKKALQLLHSAGYELINYQLVDSNNKALKLEFLTANAYHERIMGPIKKELAKLGINLIIKTVDSSQYTEALRNHDFDLILYSYSHTPSPGTEQANFWSSKWADTKGSRNLSGVKSEVVDGLLELIEKANSRSELVNTIKALDRTLLWEYTVLPLWYLSDHLVVRKKSLKYPKNHAPYALDLSTWWIGELNI